MNAPSTWPEATAVTSLLSPVPTTSTSCAGYTPVPPTSGPARRRQRSIWESSYPELTAFLRAWNSLKAAAVGLFANYGRNWFGALMPQASSLGHGHSCRRSIVSRSNRAVNCDPGSAHSTRNCVTPCVAHSTRGTSAAIQV
jgi:hypothetical protein